MATCLENDHRVLLVDDETVIIDAFSRIFLRNGIRVQSASTTAEAWHLSRRTNTAPLSPT